MKIMALEHCVLVLVVSCIAVTECLGQDSDKQDDEYVFTIPSLIPKPLYNLPRVMITTTSEDPVVATLSIPGYVLPISRTITRNNGADIQLPADIRMNRGDGKQNKTVIIRASDAVSVYAIDNERIDGDVFQCIPSSQLGTKYSVASYKPFSTSFSSFICISALHSPTTVTISNAKEIIHSVTLHQYESYRYEGVDNEDLSGLLVYGTKTIVVIAGSVASILSIVTADGILAQLPPTVSWGTDYYLFPFQSLNSGFVYRVFSFNVSTTLLFSDGTLIEILPGLFYEGDVSGDTIVFFEADPPVMVAQYIKSYDAKITPRGDPSMLIVAPVSSYYNHVTFPIFEYTSSRGHTYYINVITQCDNIDGIIFDEAISAASWNKLTTLSQTICCVRNAVSTGYHSVNHTNPNAMFFVSVYAICTTGCSSSYAYAASGIYELAQRPKPMVTTDLPNQTKQLTVSGCPKFTTPANGSLQPDKDVYTIGQVVIVFCRQGFDLIGDESLFCTDTGDWHGKTPTCIQETSENVIIISASVGGVVLIAVVLIVTVCYCRKRCKTSGDDSHDYSSNLPGLHPAPAPKDKSKLANPNTNSRDADNEAHEIPRDNAAYQDLELSTMTSSEQDYHGLYTLAT